MKKFLFLLVAAAFAISSAVNAQPGGKVYDNLTLPSKILKMDRKFAVYLPEDYELSKRSYPGLSREVQDNYYTRHSALELIKSIPDDQKKAVRWYIDCGDDDFLYEGNSLIHIAMRKKEIPHEFRIRDGGHTWTYWRESLGTVLEFVSQSFHQY